MRALYVGSFDPFTNGHYQIIKQAEDLFDEVIVGLASNPNKKRRFQPYSCLNAIAPYLKATTNLQYLEDEELTINAFERFNCDYLIRGLRNTSDYLYEEQLFYMYKELCPDLKVIYLRADNTSSSFVWELYKRNMDLTKYVPYNPKELVLYQKESY